MPRSYWWLTGKNEGKRFLIFGSDTSEDDARQHGLELLGGIDFKIVCLKTRNISQASRCLKGDVLEQTKNLGVATKRLKHKGVRHRSRRISSGF